MSCGWIAIHRRLLDHDLWLHEKFSGGQAWVDLLLMTNHKEGFFTAKNNERVPIQRGQCGVSMLTLANKWKWSRGKVSRFLNTLEAQKMIQQKRTKSTTIITVCNYEDFQQDNKRDNKQDNKRDNKQDNKRDINNKYNNENKKESAHFPQAELLASPANEASVQDKKIDTTDFDTFWKAYPRKVGKKSASTAWAKLQKQKTMPDLESLLTAIERQKQSVQWQEDKFIPHPSTWLNGERWADGAEDDGGGGVCGTTSRPDWAQNMGAIL